MGGIRMIELKQIKKSFQDHEVLKSIDLSVEKGEVVVILGPSGSGKTTSLDTEEFFREQKFRLQIQKDKIHGHKKSNILSKSLFQYI